MFRLEQVITASKFQRHFASIAGELNHNPNAVLVTRKRGSHFVFVNAAIFQQLLDFHAAMREEADSIAERVSIQSSVQS